MGIVNSFSVLDMLYNLQYVMGSNKCADKCSWIVSPLLSDFNKNCIRFILEIKLELLHRSKKSKD